MASSREVFDTRIRELISLYSTLWYETPEEPPDFLERFTPREKVTKERELDLLLRELPAWPEVHDGMDPARREKVRARLRLSLTKSLQSDGKYPTTRFIEDCEKATDSFIRAAREFDPSIADRDIHQALRNLWVFNSLQSYLSRPVSVTPSSFAYSLLYPYTDNQLDVARNVGSKSEPLLHWLTLNLEGMNPPVSDGEWTILDRLLQMIAEEYPRTRFAEVHYSLAAINNAQQKSLLLHRTNPEAGEEILLPITVEKGGTSVLADGFLAVGTLDTGATEALFGYGVLLQLVDDLQDIEEDKHIAHSTSFTWAMDRGSLDRVTNRLLNFAWTVCTLMRDQTSDLNESLCQLIRKSITLLIQEAIARYSDSYSKSYLEMMEDFAPVRLPYLAEIRQRFKSNRSGSPENIADVA